MPAAVAETSAARASRHVSVAIHPATHRGGLVAARLHRWCGALPAALHARRPESVRPCGSYGGADWGIEPAILKLIAEGVTSGAIVVGVWNSGATRWREYLPEKFVRPSWRRMLKARIAARLHGLPFSDSYLRFLVFELKPFINAHYRSLPDRPHTFVMGLSMGGLISLYALEEYPQVFGGAGCLSTHWPAGGNDLVDWMGGALPHAGQHKLYFDYGTATLDAAFEPYEPSCNHYQ